MRHTKQPTIKEEVIRLILADMRNRKLVMGLEAAGLATDEFDTDLSELIFTKMGILEKHEVRIGNWYEDMVFSMLDISLSTFRENQLLFALVLFDSLKDEIGKLQGELMLQSRPTFPFIQSTGIYRFDN